MSRIWRAFGLRLIASETCQSCNEPLLVDKVRDIVGLCLNPPRHALALCVDEKSQLQALSPAEQRSADSSDAPTQGSSQG